MPQRAGVSADLHAGGHDCAADGVPPLSRISSRDRRALTRTAEQKAVRAGTRRQFLRLRSAQTLRAVGCRTGHHVRDRSRGATGSALARVPAAARTALAVDVAGRTAGGALRLGHRDTAGHIRVRRAAQPLLTVSFIQYLNPLIQSCMAVFLLHEPMLAQGYAAFGVNLGRDCGVFVRRGEGVLGAAEAACSVSFSDSPLRRAAIQHLSARRWYIS